DEDLEVVVVENDRIVLGQGAPDVRLIQQGGDIEVHIVPEHLGASAESRARADVPLDVDKVVRPWGCLPGVVVEPAVDLDRSTCPIAEITPGCGSRRGLRHWGRRWVLNGSAGADVAADPTG